MATGLTGFKHTHVYENRAPAADVLRDLPAVAPIAQQAFARRRKTIRLAIGAFIAAGVSLVLSMIVGENPAGLTFLLLCPVLGVFGGILIFIAKRTPKVVTAPRYVDLVGHLLPILAADMAPDAPVVVRLDLLPDDHRGKPTSGPWEEQHYYNAWLRLAGRFLDGTAFQLLFTDHRRVKRKKRSKRSRSGKTKTKVKEKSRTRSTVLLRLRVKPQRYRHLERIAPEAGKAVRLPEGVEKHKVNVSPDGLSMQAQLRDGWYGGGPMRAGGVEGENAAHVVAMMFLSLYQALNLSRAIDKAQPAGGAR